MLSFLLFLNYTPSFSSLNTVLFSSFFFSLSPSFFPVFHRVSHCVYPVSHLSYISTEMFGFISHYSSLFLLEDGICRSVMPCWFCRPRVCKTHQWQLFLKAQRRNTCSVFHLSVSNVTFARIFWHPSENASVCLLCQWADVHVLFYYVTGKVIQKYILISGINADGCRVPVFVLNAKKTKH